MAEQVAPNIDLNVDRSNLYREEVFSDLRVCTVRRMIPVKPDGTEDKTRKIIFIGQTHVVTPNGPIPVQSIIKAKDLQQAFKKFPEAMKEAMERMIEEAKKMQQQQQQQEDSRIIVPGR
jgi:hypothetical protein